MPDDNQRHDLSSLKIDRNKKHSDRPRRKFWLLPVIVLVIAALIFGYFQLKEQVTPGTKVKVATVAKLSGTKSEASLVATGYVVAQRKAEVASKGTGRLKFLGFEEGDAVRTGELIAELDNEDIKAGLELANANLMRSQADYDNALRQYDRAQELRKSGSITETELEQRETAYRLAEATLAASRAAKRIAEVDLENTYIRSPFDGTILTKNADVGEIVAPFASSASSKGSVVTLADMTSLEVEADVAEANIYKVSVGQPCTIVLDAYPANPYSGRVKKIVPTADRTRATVMTKVIFDQRDERVLPEMSARVNFLLSQQEADVTEDNSLLIPKAAITNRNGVKITFVVIEGRAVQREIVTGRSLDKEIEITSGLVSGERVILSPPGKLVDGQKVEITD
ncbi:MAG: efflux RND transporter periplasmic adaptor subunit [bacterium]|nr:efflux RND transporter periplasmic adaptor subunit [bacterium]